VARYPDTVNLTVHRTAHHQDKVRAAAAAQQDGVLDEGLAPARLMFLPIAFGARWISVPQLAHMLTGAETDDPEERVRRRAFVVQAAQRVAAPRRQEGREDDRSAPPVDLVATPRCGGATDGRERGAEVAERRRGERGPEERLELLVEDASGRGE
jgi:Tetracyclin repressor-like, C-terminal domain